MAQGEGSCDGPLVVDPAQPVVALILSFFKGETILVVKAAALVGYMTSARVRRQIPWDEWKRHAMVIQFSYGISYSRIFVVGSHVMLMTRNWQNNTEGEDYRIQVYDFSRWGCMALVRVGDGEKGRMLMPDPEEIWHLRDYSGGGTENLRALGGSLVSCGVSVSRKPLKCAEGSRLVRVERCVSWRHIRLGVYLVGKSMSD